MGSRLGGLAAVLVVMVAGVFLGSAISQRLQRPESPAGPLPAAGPSPMEASEPAPPPRRIRVEVLNAVGEPGLARRATDVLRGQGFDVVFYGNADEFGADSTLVLDRVGRLAPARAVADSLGVRRVQSRPDSNLYLDVTVRLGRDWAPPPAGEEPGWQANPGPAPGERWWDPRRLFRRDSFVDPGGME